MTRTNRGILLLGSIENYVTPYPAGRLSSGETSRANFCHLVDSFRIMFSGPSYLLPITSNNYQAIARGEREQRTGHKTFRLSRK